MFSFENAYQDLQKQQLRSPLLAASLTNVSRNEACYRGAFSRNIYEDNLVFAYFSPITTILYRQWVKDNKKMPLEDLIATATRLVCGGLGEYVTG